MEAILMSTQNQKIGALLRAARKQQGISQQELARQLSLSHDAISDLEQGIRIMKVSELLELSRILQLSPTYFLAHQSQEEQSILFEQCVEILRSYPKPLLEIASVLLDQLLLLKDWVESTHSETDRIEMSLDSSGADKATDIRMRGNLVFEGGGDRSQKLKLGREQSND